MEFMPTAFQARSSRRIGMVFGFVYGFPFLLDGGILFPTTMFLWPPPLEKISMVH